VAVLEDVHGTSPSIIRNLDVLLPFGFVFEKNWLGITVAALPLIVSIYNHMHQRAWVDVVLIATPA
jgi:hypothetical protein